MLLAVALFAYWSDCIVFVVVSSVSFPLFRVGCVSLFRCLLCCFVACVSLFRVCCFVVVIVSFCFAVGA